MKKLCFLSAFIFLFGMLGNNNTAFIALKNYTSNMQYSFYVTGQVYNTGSYCVIDNAGLGRIVNCNGAISK